MALPPGFEVARLFFISRPGFLLHRGIDRGAQGGWVQRGGRNRLIVNEDGRSIPNSEGLASFSILLYLSFYLFAAHVFLKAFEVQADHSSVGVKLGLNIAVLGPHCLFL